MKRKVEWMCYITYIELFLSILHIINIKKGLSLTTIFICCFGSMLLYLLIWNMIFGVGHFMSSVYYHLKGWGTSPILLYPFVFFANHERPVQLFWNFFYMCDYYYPPGFYLNDENHNSNSISETCQKAHFINFIGELIFCIVYAGIFLVNGYVGIGLSGILLIVTLIMVANLKTEAYHGYFIRKQYIKQGYNAMYLTRYCILYTTENHDFYEAFEKLTAKGFQRDFRFICLETIKHMYMIKCVNDQFIYPYRIREQIPETCFLSNIDEYSEPDIGDEKFSLMKAYLCYCVFSNNIAGKNILRYYLQQLADAEKDSVIKFDIFQWYLQMLEDGKEPKQDSALIKNTVLRRNQFLETFSNYKKIYMYITNKMQ